MDSEKKITVVEEKDLENVELHRADSMINQQIEITQQVEQVKVPSVVHYVGTKVRSFTARIPYLGIELVMFMYMFSYAMRSISSTTMIMRKVCHVHLGYPEDICENLNDYKSIKSEVEKMANNYHLGHTLTQLVPSAFLSLFIGTWSDKYGRRIPLIAAQVGILIDGFGTIMCAYFINTRVEYYFIPALFTGFSGGFIGVLLILYSYASDVSSSGKRTMKYALMELAFGLSIPLGSLAGGWIFRYFELIPVFVVSFCGYLFTLFFVVFFLEETRGLDNKDDWATKFRNLWSFDAVISSFRVTVKTRPNKGKQQIWLMILAMSLSVFSFAASSGITYFYVFHMYNWENTAYSTISAIYSVIGLSTMIIIVPMSKRKNIKDSVLGIAGSVSLVLKNVGMGLAFKPWIYHLANIAGLLSSLGTLAGRAGISKIVPRDELGKVFAFLTTAESIFPIAATAIVSQAFNATLDFYPGLIYIVMGLLNITSIFVYIWISRLPVVNYEEMAEAQTDGKASATEETKPEKC